MRLKPKTVRRLKLLAAVTFLIVGAAFSLFVVRRWQYTRTTDRFRREGMAALDARDYPLTLDRLGRYLHRRGRTQDAEACLAWAQARAKQEEPDFSNLKEAISGYQQYLNLAPQDKAARLVFLKLCNQAGRFVEARDAAEALRPAVISQCGPEHLEILREEGIALAAGKAYETRLNQVVERIVQLAPLDLQGRLLQLEVLSQTDRRDQARDEARKLLAAHPDNPSAQVIDAASLLLDPTSESLKAAVGKLAHAVGLDGASSSFTFPDAAFAGHVADIFDRLHSFDLALKTIAKWHVEHPGRPKDADELMLARALARRLWQGGDRDGIFRHFAGGHAGNDKPLTTNWSEVDSEILGFVALSAQRTEGRRGIVPVITQELLARKDDFRAEAWSKVIPVIDPARTPDPKADSEVLKAAVKSTSRLEPVFLVMLGESLAALSRVDEARELWRNASALPVSAGWPYPHVRTAESLLSEGRADDAAVAATEALLIAPDSPIINALWFEAQAARLQRGSSDVPEPKLVLERIESAIAQIEAAGQTPEVRAVWERLLPPRVLYQARTGNRDRAIQLTRAAINGDTPLAESTIQRLASISAGEHLGIESECLSRAASKDGGSAGGGVILARAFELARAGKPAEGLDLVRHAAKDNDPDSFLAIARYMDGIGHAEAITAWIAAGDRFATNVGVQRACLSTPTTAGNREFIERTIDRYRTLSGREATAEDAVIRIARARVLLYGTPTSKDRDAAIAALALVVNAQPKLVEPRLALAAALEMSDPSRGIRPDLARAEAQLAEALNLEPRSTPIALELARVMQRQGEPARARVHLTRLASDPSTDPESRLLAARLLIVQGDVAPVALKTLEDLDAAWSGAGGIGTPPGALLSLASAYETQRQFDKATAIYTRLIDHPGADAEALYAAARFHQSHGHSDQATSVATKVERLGPGIKEALLARLAADRGDDAESSRLFNAAVTAAPTNAVLWRQFVASLLSRSETAEAVKVAQQGLAAVPNDRTLAMMLEQAKLASSDASPDFKPLIAALSRDPALSSAADVIKSIDAAQQRGELDRAEGIIALADRYSTVAPVLVYLAQRLAPLDQDRAALLANRALALAPGDAALSRSAAQLFMTLGRWNEMLAAAQVWRNADASRTAEPDIAIAQAQLGLRDYTGGLATLKPWLDAASANPKGRDSLGILNISARLLVSSGKEADARKLLEPLLSSSPDVRKAIWLRTAAELSPTSEIARAWVEQVAPFIPAESADEQLAIAGTWSVLASRFPAESKALLGRAREHLAAQSQNAPTAAIWEALGVVCHREGDLPAAKSAYEKALALDARRSVSLNNLASILFDNNHDAAAALPFAKRGVEASADPSALATLASIQTSLAESAQKAGDSASISLFKDASDTSMKLAKALPRDAQAWGNAAEVATNAGDHAAAVAAWSHVIELPGLAPKSLADAKNNLAMAILQTEPGKDQLDRARALINEALNTVDEPAFRDSLGWVELQAARRDQAIQAFRKAIGVPDQSKPPMRSAAIGLATALASGSAEERKEAASLLRNIDPKDLDANLAAKFRRVHAMVDADKP